MIRNRFNEIFRSLRVPEAYHPELLKTYDFRRGDTFQIYSVKGNRIYESVDLEDYPTTRGRSAVFRKWIFPILSELENRTFCVHLGDSPCAEIVEGMLNFCYCKRKTDERDLTLIPDTYYQSQKGYVSRREYKKLYKSPWENKFEKVIFRGAYTGEKPLDKNMRAQLCALNNPLIDAKLTGVNNPWEEEEIRHLRGEYMSKYEMGKYKYQIDVDGNTNSWDAFFWKLMSGSLTFKLKSEWHQWYYHEIQSGTHYVEFGDFDDLVDKLMFYKQHDDSAKKIALNAQNFTKGFRFEDQYKFFLDALQLPV